MGPGGRKGWLAKLMSLYTLPLLSHLVQCHDSFYYICSAVVGPRCPLKMDPDLDYEVDSDDEWEEVLVDTHVSFLSLLVRDIHVLCSTQEDPGESLSDCEKDGDEVMEEDSKITDEDEDSFVVPDGYLSDNEV